MSVLTVSLSGCDRALCTGEGEAWISRTWLRTEELLDIQTPGHLQVPQSQAPSPCDSGESSGPVYFTKAAPEPALPASGQGTRG